MSKPLIIDYPYIVVDESSAMSDIDYKKMIAIIKKMPRPKVKLVSRQYPSPPKERKELA